MKRCSLGRGALTGAGALLLGGCAALTERHTGVVDGALWPCPPAPRCVSSGAVAQRHRIAALELRDDPPVWQTVRALIDALPRTRVVAFDDRYLRAEIVSPWGVYTDDLELLRGADGTTAVRSSARLGYYDFEVNRERVETLRAALNAAGVGAR